MLLFPPKTKWLFPERNRPEPYTLTHPQPPKRLNYCEYQHMGPRKPYKRPQIAVLPLNSVPHKKCFRWKRHSNGITELLWLSCLFWAPLGLDFVTSREAQSQAWIWCWMCRFKFRIHVGITKPGRFLQTYGKGISRHCGTLLLWKWMVK